MACLLTNGDLNLKPFILNEGNKDFVKRIYIAKASEVASITDTNLPVLDTIVMVGAAVFYKFDFEEYTASYTQELQVSGGKRYVTQTVTFSLAGQDAEAVNFLTKIVTSELVVIVESKTGVRTVLGLQTSLEVITGTIFTSDGGVIILQADANGFGLQLDSNTVIPQ